MDSSPVETDLDSSLSQSHLYSWNGQEQRCADVGLHITDRLALWPIPTHSSEPFTHLASEPSHRFTTSRFYK